MGGFCMTNVLSLYAIKLSLLVLYHLLLVLYHLLLALLASSEMWMLDSISTTPRHTYHTEKYKIANDLEALENVLQTIEDDGITHSPTGFLSHLTEPHLGDLAVFGTLRAIEGLPAHDTFVIERGDLLYEWYEQMQSTMKPIAEAK
jgi:hypothetical protein